jgi:hypothetical protein
MKISVTRQTKRQKKKGKNKKALWDQFDDMIGVNDQPTLECLYSKQTIGYWEKDKLRTMRLCSCL